MGHAAQHRDFDRAPQTKQVLDAEHHHREDVEGVEKGAVAGGDVVDRLGGEGDGIEENEDDDEGVDDMRRGMRVAADFENVVDLSPPAPPDRLFGHSF